MSKSNRRVSDKQTFIDSANTKFGFKFDYSLFTYVNAKTKSIIVCPTHGEFEQNPDKHLSSKHGCPKCFEASRGSSRVGKPSTYSKPVISREEYMLRVTERYGAKFEIDLSEYEGLCAGSVTIKCSLHGHSTYKPQAFLISGHGCRQCGEDSKNRSRTQSYEQFVVDAIEKHGTAYIYPETCREYKTRRSMVEIHCPVHGVFYKTAQKHLAGQGCFECQMEKLVAEGRLLGGYSKGYFKRNPDQIDRPAQVYYLKVGKFYKIGITTNLAQRLRAIKSKSKQEVIILDVLDTTLQKAFNLEQKILRKHKMNKARCKWTTEAFKVDVLNGVIPREQK